MMKKIVCLVFVLMLFGCSDNVDEVEKAVNLIPAAELHDLAEYTDLEEKNFEVFKAIGFEGVEYIIENRLDAYLWLSYPDCSNCQETINEIAGYAREKGITLYYFNPKAFASNQEEYEKLLDLFDPVLARNDEGERKVFTPELIRFENGEFADHHIGTDIEGLKSVIVE